jgi:hypothetical protein
MSRFNQLVLSPIQYLNNDQSIIGSFLYHKYGKAAPIGLFYRSDTSSLPFTYEGFVGMDLLDLTKELKTIQLLINENNTWELIDNPQRIKILYVNTTSCLEFQDFLCLRPV